MYFDKIHMNDKVVLPALIRHIKFGMNLDIYQYRPNKQPRNNSQNRINRQAGNHAQNGLEYAQERQSQPVNTLQNITPVSLGMSSSAGNQSGFKTTIWA